MTRPIGTTGKAQVLSEQEFRRVISVIKGHYSEKNQLRNAVIVFISFYLGLRVSEIAKLKVHHVFDIAGEVKSYLRLTSSMTKGGKPRDVYISHPALIKQLKQYWELLTDISGNDVDVPLFRSQKGGTFSAKTMGRLLKDIYILAGFPSASSHSGRRSMITNLIHAGFDMKSVSLLAGHNSISTTAIYVESNPERLSGIMSNVFK